MEYFISSKATHLENVQNSIERDKRYSHVNILLNKNENTSLEWRQITIRSITKKAQLREFICPRGYVILRGIKRYRSITIERTPYNYTCY
jgi:hypothetical protein